MKVRVAQYERAGGPPASVLSELEATTSSTSPSLPLAFAALLSRASAEQGASSLCDASPGQGAAFAGRKVCSCPSDTRLLLGACSISSPSLR